MKVLLVAGEASGDLHAANLLHALRGAGLDCIARSEELSVMGLAEVARDLPRLLRLARRVAGVLDGPEVESKLFHRSNELYS